MTEQDELYIKSHRLWLKSTVRNLKEFHSEIYNCNRKIENLKEEIFLYRKRIENDKKYLASGQKSFGVYCHENNIDPDVNLED